MRRTYATLLSLALAAALFSACEQANTEKKAEATSDAEIVSFAFLAASNASLSEDAEATIAGNDISLSIPASSGREALVASFETTGASVYVGSAAQVSDSTANDFSSAITYTVRAEDGSTRDYAVNVAYFRVSGLAPADGSVTAASAPSLGWNALAGAAGYQVQFAGEESAVAGKPTVSVASTAYEPDFSPGGADLYWRVRAVDAGGGAYSEWSAIRRVSLDWGASAPVLSGPETGLTTEDSTPALGWEAYGGAEGYVLEIAPDSPDGLSAAEGIDLAEPAFQVTKPLRNETSYFWRVRAAATDGVTGETAYSAYSEVRSLTVRWGPTGPADGIQSAEELAAIGVTMPLDGNYVLAGDMDFAGVTDWVPIGTEKAPFTGTLNGNGHSISNLYMRTEGITGLFGYLGPGGTLENIALDGLTAISTSGFVGGLVSYNKGGTVVNCSVSGRLRGYTGRVGGIAAYSSGDIVNCSVSGSVESSSGTAGGVVAESRLDGTSPAAMTVSGNTADCTVSGSSAVGGIIGSQYNYVGDKTCTIAECRSSGAVTGGAKTGGLIGICYSGSDSGTLIIRDCSASGDVAGKTASGDNGTYGHTGGLIGCMYRAYEDTTNAAIILRDCSASGKVTGTHFTGGLLGRNGYDSGMYVHTTYGGGQVLSCFATGNVTGSGNHTGGLIGMCTYGTLVSASYAEGDVLGSARAGGFLGSAAGIVSDCYALGDVAGTGYSAGFAGYNGATVSNCYSVGTVAPDGESHVGGFTNGNAVTACFYDVESEGQSADSALGTPLTGENLKSADPFVAAGWDFAGETDNGIGDIWSIDPEGAVNGGYPYLTGL